MNKLKFSTFEAWIFDSFRLTSEGLGLYRIFTALFILLFTLPSPGLYGFLGNLPADFFSPPPGPMMLFDGFPPEYVLLTLHYLLMAALVLLCIGFSTKISSIMVGVLLLILKGFIFSLGKINHDILLAAVPLVMAFSGWGGVYSVDALRDKKEAVAPQAWTLTLLALLIGFMMFTAGFPKILGGWMHIDTHAVQGHYIKQFFVRGRQDLLAPYARNIGPAVWEIFDYATVLFEVGFLVAICNPKSTRFFICLAVLFHFGTMLILNIAFLPNFVAYAAFLNWSRICEWLKNRLPVHGASVPAVSTALFMAALAALAAFLERCNFLSSDLSVESVVFISLSVPVALYCMVNILKRSAGEYSSDG